MFTLDARKQGEESDYQSVTYQGSGEDWISILYRIIHWYIPETKSPTIHCMHGLSPREWQSRSHRALPRIPRVLIIPLVRKHASPKYYDKMIVCRHWVTVQTFNRPICVLLEELDTTLLCLPDIDVSICKNFNHKA